MRKSAPRGAPAPGGGAAGQDKKTAWPLSLADGLPKELPGYIAAPTDPLPDTDENDMGVFTEVARFFQRIESPTVTRQFQLVVQDYGKDNKDLEARASARRWRRPGTHPGVETRDVDGRGTEGLRRDGPVRAATRRPS